MKYSSVIKLTSLLLIFTASTAIGQVSGAKHQKLIDLYVMGKFEDCLNKAAKMTENDKYRSESEPYLWMSMCLIELKDDPELFEFYPNALKDALKYGVKFKKKDDKLKSKEEDYLFDDNKDFIYKLIEEALTDGKSFFVQDNYSKAAYYYKTAKYLDEDNKECLFMYGVVNMYNRNTKEGKIYIDDALTYFKATAEAGGYEINPKTEQAFDDSFYYYTQYLLLKGQNSEALKVIGIAVKLTPQNQKLITLYKEVNAL